MRNIFIVLDFLILVLIYLVWKDMTTAVPILTSIGGLLITIIMLFMFVFITIGRLR